MIYKQKFSYYTSLTPIFTYHFNDINHKKMDIKNQVDYLIQKLNNFKIIFKLPLSQP